MMKTQFRLKDNHLNGNSLLIGINRQQHTLPCLRYAFILKFHYTPVSHFLLAACYLEFSINASSSNQPPTLAGGLFCSSWTTILRKQQICFAWTQKWSFSQSPECQKSETKGPHFPSLSDLFDFKVWDVVLNQTLLQINLKGNLWPVIWSHSGSICLVMVVQRCLGLADRQLVMNRSFYLDRRTVGMISHLQALNLENKSEFWN